MTLAAFSVTPGASPRPAAAGARLFFSRLTLPAFLVLGSGSDSGTRAALAAQNHSTVEAHSDVARVVL